MKGKRYGIIGSHATPLFNVEVGRFFRFFEQAKGSFNLAMFELSYYTDSATGKLLERFSNPFTGAVNDVMRLARRPFISQYTAADRFFPALKNSAASYRSQVMPLFVDGDRVEIGSRVNAMMPSPFPKTPNTRINEYITVTGRRSDLLDPCTKSAPAELSYQNIQPWEPWMMMGDQPGQMVSWATGRKYESLAGMPSGYLKMARAVHPWLIRDPIETLAVQARKIRDLSVG